MSTDNNESRKIVEDSPIMRSVALVAPPFMPMMRPLTPLKVPSAAVYEATSAKLHVTPLNKSPLPDWSEITCFPAFPTGYFLERTHVRIHDATPEEVLSRVSAILSHESVATRYDTNEVRLLNWLGALPQ